MSKLGPGGLWELLRVPPGQRHPAFDPSPNSPYGSGQVPGTPTGHFPAATVGGMTGTYVGGVPPMGVGGIFGPPGHIWNPNPVTPGPIIPNIPPTPTPVVPNVPPAPAPAPPAPAPAAPNVPPGPPPLVPNLHFAVAGTAYGTNVDENPQRYTKVRRVDHTSPLATHNPTYYGYRRQIMNAGNTISQLQIARCSNGTGHRMLNLPNLIDAPQDHHDLY